MSNLIARLRTMADIAAAADEPTLYEAIAALEQHEPAALGAEGNRFVPSGYTLTEDGTALDEEGIWTMPRPRTTAETTRLFRLR